MNHRMLYEKYPLYVPELERDECRFADVDAICGYFRSCVEAHPCGRFIAIFDHYAHTCSLADGTIGDGICAAKNVVFCFGLALPHAEVLAVRPRSIGVAQTETGFVISFMEAPMPIANAAMEDWADGLRSPVAVIV